MKILLVASLMNIEVQKISFLRIVSFNALWFLLTIAPQNVFQVTKKVWDEGKLMGYRSHV